MIGSSAGRVEGDDLSLLAMCVASKVGGSTRLGGVL